MKTEPCMGGWCVLRASCGHYQAEDRREPAESLCRDQGGSQWVPIRQPNEHRNQEAVSAQA